MKHVDLSSVLARGSSFRESLRSKGVNTEHLDRAQTIVSAALAKHGEERLTAENFAKVMEHARGDSGWARTYSSGNTLEAALKDHLEIKD